MVLRVVSFQINTPPVTKMINYLQKEKLQTTVISGLDGIKPKEIGLGMWCSLLLYF